MEVEVVIIVTELSDKRNINPEEAIEKAKLEIEAGHARVVLDSSALIETEDESSTT